MKLSAEIACPQCRLIMLTGPHSRDEAETPSPVRKTILIKCPHCESVMRVRMELVKPGKAPA